MKFLLSLLLITICLISCKKNDFPKHEDFYLQMRVNGQSKTFGMCAGFPPGTGGGQFECSLRDTVLFIAAGCGDYAGFYLKGNIIDGTYALNNQNMAWVSKAYNNDYKTTLINTGSLTISRVLFKNIKSLQGTFSYKGIDTTGEIATITDGSFLMEIHN